MSQCGGGSPLYLSPSDLLSTRVPLNAQAEGRDKAGEEQKEQANDSQLTGGIMAEDYKNEKG
jgi:hypothetical protein